MNKIYSKIAKKSGKHVPCEDEERYRYEYN